MANKRGRGILENLINERGVQMREWVENFEKSDKPKKKGEILGVWLWKALVLGLHETYELCMIKDFWNQYLQYIKHVHCWWDYK